MKIKFLLAFTLFSMLLLNKTEAQLHISLNIGTQPLWGPVGYDHVDNYYLPDIQAYYNVQNQQYTYMERGRWITRTSLPPQYRNYDLYSGYKVVVNEPRPYMHDAMYRQKYASYRDRHDQQVIRDSREQKYFENKNHPMHDQWKGNDHDDRDRKGHGDHE